MHTALTCQWRRLFGVYLNILFLVFKATATCGSVFHCWLIVSFATYFSLPVQTEDPIPKRSPLFCFPILSVCFLLSFCPAEWTLLKLLDCFEFRRLSPHWQAGERKGNWAGTRNESPAVGRRALGTRWIPAGLTGEGANLLTRKEPGSIPSPSKQASQRASQSASHPAIQPSRAERSRCHHHHHRRRRRRVWKSSDNQPAIILPSTPQRHPPSK